MILTIVLLMLVGIAYLKYSGNNELAKKCCKTEQDKANVKNARKVYSSTKTTKALLILTFLAAIVVCLLVFTNADYFIRDFLSADFVNKKEYSYYLLLIPFYILVSRQIIIEVNLGDFLYKFFNEEEPVLEENLIKTLLYKKGTKNNPEERKVEEPAKEEQQEESKEEVVDLPKETPPNDIELPQEATPTDIELPQEKKED